MVETIPVRKHKPPTLPDPAPRNLQRDFAYHFPGQTIRFLQVNQLSFFPLFLYLRDFLPTAAIGVKTDCLAFYLRHFIWCLSFFVGKVLLHTRELHHRSRTPRLPA